MTDETKDDGPRKEDLVAWKGLAEKHIVDLEEKVRRLKAENQVWRELIADFRELVVQIHQAFPMSKGYKRIRECMADDRVMEAEVQAMLQKKLEKG